MTSRRNVSSKLGRIVARQEAAAAAARTKGEPEATRSHREDVGHEEEEEASL